MPRYLSQHTMACLTRQGAEELTTRLHAAQAVKTLRVLIAMHGGKMFVEFDASSREQLEDWLESEKFHFDWLIRIDYESSAGQLLAT
jgi:predicted SpoU family rRNA methylase